MPFNLGIKVSATESEMQQPKQLTLSFFKNDRQHSVSGSEESVLFLAQRFNANMMSKFSVSENGVKKAPRDFGLDDKMFHKWDHVPLAN